MYESLSERSVPLPSLYSPLSQAPSTAQELCPNHHGIPKDNHLWTHHIEPALPVLGLNPAQSTGGHATKREAYKK